MAQPRRQPGDADIAPTPIRKRAPARPRPAAAAPKPAPKRQIDLGVRTYKGAIYDALSSMIAELELPPGARLVEADLVQRFNVSKTPIREAFLLLEGDGLVELVPYVGARVTWMSLDTWEESQFIFDALEQPALARISERITPRDIKALHRLSSRLRKLRRERNSAAYAKTMWEIHQRLFAPTGYPRLLSLLLNEGRRIGRRYQRAFIHEFDDLWDLEMEVVLGRLDGVVRGDPAGAAALVAEGHGRLLALLRARADDPRIAPYLAH
jgi:DNA-binding GntR family transcriptional regulator